jgi:hypothetical protein
LLCLCCQWYLRSWQLARVMVAQQQEVHHLDRHHLIVTQPPAARCFSPGAEATAGGCMAIIHISTSCVLAHAASMCVAALSNSTYVTTILQVLCEQGRKSSTAQSSCTVLLKRTQPPTCTPQSTILARGAHRRHSKKLHSKQQCVRNHPRQAQHGYDMASSYVAATAIRRVTNFMPPPPWAGVCLTLQHCATKP